MFFWRESNQLTLVSRIRVPTRRGAVDGRLSIPGFAPWDFLRSRKLVITAAQALHTHSPLGERSRVWFGGETPQAFPNMKGLGSPYIPGPMCS